VSDIEAYAATAYWAAYREAGLAYMRLDRQEMAERLGSNQKLLRLPLVRFENHVTAGSSQATWKALVAGAAAGPSAGSAASGRPSHRD